MSTHEGHNPIDFGDDDERLKNSGEENLVRQQEQDDIAWLMRHKVGRRLVWRMLEGAGIYKTSFRTDALHTAFLEGRRNWGLEMLHEVVSISPKHYNIMLAENRNG